MEKRKNKFIFDRTKGALLIHFGYMAKIIILMT